MVGNGKFTYNYYINERKFILETHPYISHWTMIMGGRVGILKMYPVFLLPLKMSRPSISKSSIFMLYWMRVNTK